jgi:putative inorganic carbon (hco3(-)) transporter
MRPRSPVIAPLSAGLAASILGGAIVLIGLDRALAVAPVSVLVVVVLVTASVLVVLHPEALLLVLVASLPWESKLAYPSATVTVVAFIRVTLPALFLARAFVRRDRLMAPRFLVPLGVFLLLTMLSLMVSPDPSEGITKTLRYGIFASSLFAAIQLLDDRATVLRAIRLLAISASAASIYALVSFLSGELTRAAGPIADPNDFGDLIVAVIPLALFLFVEDRKWRVLWGLVLATLLAAALGSLSRGALVGLGGLLVWGILTRRVSAVALLGAGTLIAMVLVVGFAFFGSVVERRLSDRERITSSSAAARIAFWEAAANMSADHPLLGVGPERYDAERENYLYNSPIPLEGRENGQQGPVHTVHNSYLEVAAENGIPAALAFCLFLLAIWISLRNYLLDPASQVDDQGRRLAAALQGVLIAAVLSGFFVSAELEASFWLAAVLAGALTAGSATGTRRLAEGSPVNA